MKDFKKTIIYLLLVGAIMLSAFFVFKQPQVPAESPEIEIVGDTLSQDTILIGD